MINSGTIKLNAIIIGLILCTTSCARKAVIFPPTDLRGFSKSQIEQTVKQIDKLTPKQRDLYFKKLELETTLMVVRNDPKKAKMKGITPEKQELYLLAMQVELDLMNDEIKAIENKDIKLSQ